MLASLVEKNQFWHRHIQEVNDSWAQVVPFGHEL
jgi:hypothetical protein